MTVLDSITERGLTADLVLDVLSDHVGAANGITATHLVRKVCGFSTAAAERKLRTVVEELRREGHAIAAHPTHGYFVPATAAELDETCEFLYARAMTSLVQIAALRRVALPNLRGQLKLPLDGSAP